jgi:hypothetical protein
VAVRSAWPGVVIGVIALAVIIILLKVLGAF